MHDVRLEPAQAATRRWPRLFRRIAVVTVAAIAIAGPTLLPPAAPAHAEATCGEVLLEDAPEVLCISLTPESGSSAVGAKLSLIATVTLGGVLDDGDPVSITVESGPNAGAHIDGITPVSGRVILTYNGNGGAGLDTIRACVAPGATCPVSAVATHSWIAPAATAQPTATSVPPATPTPVSAATPTVVVEATAAGSPSPTPIRDASTSTPQPDMPPDATTVSTAQGATMPAAAPSREPASESTAAPPAIVETAGSGSTPKSEVLASGKSAPPRTSTSRETSSAAELASTEGSSGTARWPWALGGVLLGVIAVAAASLLGYRRWKARES